MYVKELHSHETILVKFEGRQEFIEICGNGTIKKDLVSHGSEENIFNGNATAGWTNGLDQRRLDNVGQYLHLLYGALHSGHKVNSEIDEALSKFKKEAGI